MLTDPRRLWDGLPTLPTELAATAHACTHCTMVPALVSGGDKPNTIPAKVQLVVNARPTLGDTSEKILHDIRELVADLVAPDDVVALATIEPSTSPIDTPLWPVLEAVTARHHPGARLVPSILPAQTDARWLRPAGVTTYGFGVLSTSVSPLEYWARFHGRNERIDLDSLALSLAGWTEICTTFLS